MGLDRRQAWAIPSPGDLNIWMVGRGLENPRVPNAWLKDITCYRNDINQVGSVAGGSLKCRGYFVATQDRPPLSPGPCLGCCSHHPLRSRSDSPILSPLR